MIVAVKIANGLFLDYRMHDLACVLCWLLCPICGIPCQRVGQGVRSSTLSSVTSDNVFVALA